MNSIRCRWTRAAVVAVAASAAWATSVLPAHAMVRFVAATFETPPVDGTGFAEGVATSPDGAHVYVVGASGGLAVFRRDAMTGQLAFVESHHDGVASVDGMNGADGVAVSPDGAHVYVAGSSDDGVAVFSRNITTGQLTFVEAKKDGVGGVDGIDGASSVVVSPDGNQVYATGFNDNAVAVFSRNPTSGQLTFVEIQKDGIAGVDGLAGAQHVAFSPDGSQVYATGATDDALVVFSRNSTTGHLSFVEVEKDAVGGVDGLDGAFGVVVSPDGKHVYVGGRLDDALAVFSRDPLSGQVTFVEAVKDGVDGVQGLAGATDVVVSADGRQVYVGSYGAAVAAFGRDATTGHPAFQQVEASGSDGIDGLLIVLSVALSPDGTSLYATGAFDSGVSVFSRDPGTGDLAYVELQQQSVGTAGLSNALAAAASPDGKNLYVAGFDDDAVAVFRPVATKGTLSFVQQKVDGVSGVDGLDGAYSVAVSPDGKNVYAAGSNDNAVTVFGRDTTSGELTFVEAKKDGVGGVDGLAGAGTVTVSPDGSHVYAAGYNDNAVAVFSRNPSTGALTFVEKKTDGVAGVDGLNHPRSITVSPDGNHVYVAGEGDDAIAVFGRNAATGQLAFVEIEKNLVGGVDGLDAPFSVAVSPDGAHVYAASYFSSAVAVFGRNATTGQLTFVEAKKDGVGGVDGIGGAVGVAVSLDGRWVYVAGSGENALAVFSRDASTGQLTLDQVSRDGVGGVDGLAGARSVVPLSDGRHVYVASNVDSAVAVFEQQCGNGVVDPGETCDDGNTTDGDCCSSTCQFEAATCEVILGKSFIVKDPKPGVDATKRSISLIALEKSSPDVIFGDPVASGAQLTIRTAGANGTVQTFPLPAGAAWRAYPGGLGFKYSDGSQLLGPVKTLQVRRTPTGVFQIKASISAKTSAVNVIPPDPGTAGSVKLTILDGHSYCMKLGGAAGGAISPTANTDKLFKISATGTTPAAEDGCP